MQGKFISDNTVSERQMPVLTNRIDTRSVEQAVEHWRPLGAGRGGGVALFATRHCYLVIVLLLSWQQLDANETSQYMYIALGIGGSSVGAVLVTVGWIVADLPKEPPKQRARAVIA